MKMKELLASKEGAILGFGATEQQIREAEASLGLHFAEDYREYLSTVGLAMCDGHEFTGICKAERTNVVAVTEQMRALQGDIPADRYVIENENMDGAAIWQDAEGNVYFNRKRVYGSLREFLSDL